jgi:hypothetical protein
MIRTERNISQLSHFCTIDEVQYFDADFTNVHYTMWNSLSSSEKKDAKTKFAKEIKVSKLGNVIRVNGSRRCSDSQTHTDINGNSFSYKKVRFNNPPFQISVPKNVCSYNGKRANFQLSRVMACTFLEQGKGLLEVDHINSKKNFQNKIEAEKLENLQWMDSASHKEKTSIDLSDTKSNKSINNARDKELNETICLILEIMEGKTYYSKSLSPLERSNKANEIRKELTNVI